MSTLSALPSPDASVQNQSYQFNRQLPLSASNLSVNYLQSPSVYNSTHCQNFVFPSNPSSLAPSPTRNSLNESLASSINDLTVETEQLERAIRHNDTRFVRRMLELYHNKFVFSTNIRASYFEKSSLETRSMCAGSQHDRSSLFKGQTYFDRKESGSTAEPGGESPAIFTNALHLAIESNAYDVTLLLLRSSFDPNEAGVTPFTSLDIWRRRSDSSYESAALAATNGNNNLNVCRVNSFSTSREQLIPHSVRSTSPHLLSPVLGQSVLSSSKDMHHFIRFSINSSPSSANSEVSSIGRYSTPTKVIKMKSELSAKLRTVHLGGSEETNPVTYEEEYTRDTLYALPPIFLATALNNAPILRELIKFGANVNIFDRHGVTPLHLAVCQERISRSCVHTLIQSGAKTNAKNKLGITPCDLLESRGNQLTELQKLMVDNAFSQIVLQQSLPSVVAHTSKQHASVEVDEISSPSLGLLFEDGNSTSADVVKVIHPEEESESGEFNILYTTRQSSVLNGSTSLSANKSKLLKKLKPKTKRTKSQENTVPNSGPDVYLCLEELSSDGPSHSSIQDNCI
ncbi:uncharacterized protein B4U80_02538 [Leptotrombidium deliense]|uniref:Alpha-latrotoxin n=1 Tax=Leptotrombidium deliense TaxID=299467 RepID=A0A443SV63_9ACAR|nr:uncharacterized protein B4U80_02538 [Leptotrombidium deliense]